MQLKSVSPAIECSNNSLLIHREISEIIKQMQYYTLQEGMMYRCILDTRINFMNADKPEDRGVLSVVKEGTVVVALRTRDGEEAVLIDGTVVPFSWSKNVAYLMFEPVKE